MSAVALDDRESDMWVVDKDKASDCCSKAVVEAGDIATELEADSLPKDLLSGVAVNVNEE